MDYWEVGVISQYDSSSSINYRYDSSWIVKKDGEARILELIHDYKEEFKKEGCREMYHHLSVDNIDNKFSTIYTLVCSDKTIDVENIKIQLIQRFLK